jgi:hypothetical protein
MLSNRDRFMDYSFFAVLFSGDLNKPLSWRAQLSVGCGKEAHSTDIVKLRHCQHPLLTTQSEYEAGNVKMLSKDMLYASRWCRIFSKLFVF